MRRLRSISPLAVLALVTVQACQESPPSGANVSEVTSSLATVAMDPQPSQLAIAQAVPGFGGYFIDAQGRPAVYLLDPAAGPAAAAALGGFLADRGFAAADLQVLQGSFTYAQLDAWYRAARLGVFSVDGIILGDVDEGANRLRFGVVDAAAAAGVSGVLAQLGIPASAAIVQQRAPIRTLATLRERVRPLRGGLQINFFPTPVAAPTVVSLLCTLGFNAEIYGVKSFITNSHCSNVEGGEETPTLYYQARRSGGAADFIATEVDDPHWTSQLNLDCPPPLACRWSDASRAAYDAAVLPDFRLGQIARVDEISTSLADTTHTIAGMWAIRATQDDPVQGEVADKTGRTTGWTRGNVTGTCVDIIAVGTNHIRLCQVLVNGIVDGGDSGSPVFRRRNNGEQVTLLGILWGGSTDEAVQEWAHSPLSGIKKDLGNIRVF